MEDEEGNRSVTVQSRQARFHIRSDCAQSMNQWSGRCQPVRPHEKGDQRDVNGEATRDREDEPTAEGQAAPRARPRGRLADEVHDTLLAQLMSLRIVPDSRVTIDALARELGVSQTP